MQVVINISETLKDIADKDDIKTFSHFMWQCILIDAIKNGTPLPKGHGRLIDADAFIAMLEDVSKRQRYKELLIDDYLTVDDVFKSVIESLLNKGLAEGDALTIIDADRSEEE